jgi:hypothetical protein
MVWYEMSEQVGHQGTMGGGIYILLLIPSM